jgi:HSP20 family protein
MKSQQAIESQAKTSPATPISAEAEKLFEKMKELTQAISRRAYEFFEARGREIGHELEDWFRAESELLRRVPVEIEESNEKLTVRAEVPGLSANDIQVCAEPHRLILSSKIEPPAEQKAEKIIYNERCPNGFCRTLDLHAEIDTAKTTATLKNGILEIALPKVPVSKALQIEVKAG